MLGQEQILVKEWLEKQPFGPGQKAWEPLLGMIEELGELSRAQLKAHQKIRGTQEEHDDKAKDSIGDLTVFILGFCNTIGLEVKYCQIVVNLSDTFHSPQDCIFQISKRIGALADYWSDVGGSAKELAVTAQLVGEAITWMFNYCRCRNWSFQTCVDMAINEIQGRDWNANPQDGKTTPLKQPYSYCIGPELCGSCENCLRAQGDVDCDDIEVSIGDYEGNI